MCLLAVDGAVLSVNPALGSMLGRQPGTLLGCLWPDLADPEDAEAEAVLVERLVSGEIPSYQLQRRFAVPDGSVVSGDVSVCAVRDPDGAVGYLIAVISDTTCRVPAHSVLEHCAERFRLLADNASDVVLETDSDGRFVWVSPSVTTTLGWDPEVLLERNHAELVHPEDLEAGRRALREVLSAGTTRGWVEGRFATADGGWRWMAGRGHALLDVTGAPIGAVYSLRDIDAEVRARDALRESQAYFRVMAENASDVVLEAAPDNTYRWVSPSVTQSLGWAPEELVGRTAADMVHPQDFPSVAAARTHTQGGVSKHDAFRFRKRDGDYVWMSGLSREIRDAQGNLTGRVVALRDVEDLVNTSERALAGEARLQATMDSLLDPHVLLQVVRDPAGEVIDFVHVDVNEAACSETGIPREQYIGTSLLDLSGAVGEGLLDLLRRSFESAVPLVRDDWMLPAGILDDGRHYDIRAVRVGERLSFTFRDVTERHRQATALANSEAQLRLLVENVTDFVMRSNPQGLLDWVSESVIRVLGWAPEELIGKPVLSLIHPDDLAATPKVQEELAQGSALTVESRMRTAAGDYRWTVATVRPIIDDRGQVSGTVAGCRDVEAEHATREALAASDARYRLVADNVYDVVLRSRDGQIHWVSPSLIRELGWTPEEWIGHHVYEFLHPGDKRAMAIDQVHAYAQGTSLSRVRLRDKHGTYHHVETHTREVRSEHKQPDGVVSTFRTIDAEVLAEAELDRRAKYDDLTGVLKRDEALSGLTQIVRRTRRSPGQHTAVAFCDVDDFKGINDAHGHTGGDTWLSTTAQRLAETIRNGDILARMGGDEFLIVLDGVHDLAEATAIAAKLNSVASQPVTIDGEPVSATMSVGVTLADPQEPIDTMISRADRAMYKAKRAGRDQVIPLPGPPTRTNTPVPPGVARPVDTGPHESP